MRITVALVISLVLHLIILAYIPQQKVYVVKKPVIEVTIIEGKENKLPGEGDPGAAINKFIKEVAPEIYKQEQAEKDEGCLF